MWYSTTKSGWCGAPDADPSTCTWDAVVEKVINKTCSDNIIFDAIESYDRKHDRCFEACPARQRQPSVRNTTDTCWIYCCAHCGDSMAVCPSDAERASLMVPPCAGRLLDAPGGVSVAAFRRTRGRHRHAKGAHHQRLQSAVSAGDEWWMPRNIAAASDGGQEANHALACAPTDCGRHVPRGGIGRGRWSSDPTVRSRSAPSAGARTPARAPPPRARAARPVSCAGLCGGLWWVLPLFVVCQPSRAPPPPAPAPAPRGLFHPGQVFS
jgi:hypothetical protein